MFIRTKDGIYDFEEQRGNIENRGEKSFLAIGNDYRGCTCYDYEEIIQEADTIEELIDGYIFVSKSGETHYIYGFDYDMGVKTSSSIIESDEAFKKHLLENGTIYGAIWTSKGLIYVAKMNENGKLVLI